MIKSKYNFEQSIPKTNDQHQPHFRNYYDCLLNVTVLRKIYGSRLKM
jgi:hypothetical protein